MHSGFKVLQTTPLQMSWLQTSRVPPIGTLHDQLGFRRASKKQKNSFKISILRWRRSYLTSDGKPASDLLDWNATSIQQELTESAERFLDVDSNGERFWSADRQSELKFPADRGRIADLLKQLFWRQNMYHRRNTRYKYVNNKAIRPTDGLRNNSIPVGNAVEANRTSSQYKDSQIGWVNFCPTPFASSTATHRIGMSHPTRASSAPETGGIQARTSSESDASRADEGSANDSKQRKRQYDSSIPWDPHFTSCAVVHQPGRDDQAETIFQAEVPTEPSLSRQFSPPSTPYIVPIAITTVPESPKDDHREFTILNAPGSDNNTCFSQGCDSEEPVASLMATKSTPLPSVLGQEGNTREFDATPGQASQRQHLVRFPVARKHKTRVSMWIVTPRFSLMEELWADGKMQGSTLLAFTEGISRLKQLGRIEAIKLTLRATVMSATRDTIITISNGDEDLWSFTKDTFKDKMKEAMAEAEANNSRACLRILVEPLYEQEELEF